MRWSPGGTSDNVEDRPGMRLGRGGLGIGGGLVLLILSLVFGRNFFEDAGSGPVTTQRAAEVVPINETPEEKVRVQFVSFVLDDVQATWARLLPQMGPQYRVAKLVLFRDMVQSACGTTQSASGPFY